MDLTDRDLRDAVAFSLLPRIGSAAFREGVEKYGAAAVAFRSCETESERAEALREADDVLARAGAAGARVLVLGEPEYPADLLDLTLPPALVFALGSTRWCAQRRVGIVGTRQSSQSGERFAHQLASALVRAGIVVVSGMALGIDAAAHRGALDAGGGTIAVLGGGADLPYPPSHAALHRRIIDHGLVLSEARPGSRPVKGAFPKRNRIIAALSELLIVVEAGERSGALITSRLALELGRTVAAVPGPIDSPRHVGSNGLLSEGASFISKVEDALSLLGFEKHRVGSAKVEDDRGPAVDDDESQAILKAIRAGASDLEGIAQTTGLSARAFATALSTLEMSGLLHVAPNGSIALTDRA